MTTMHQYIHRSSRQVCNEPLFGDRIIRWLYHPVRENAPLLFRLITGPHTTKALGFFNYDLALSTHVLGNHRFLKEAGINLGECLDPLRKLDTARKVFERKIRYWQYRPMPESREAIVSPADARAIVGSLDETSNLSIKGKFFTYEELLGLNKSRWINTFNGGDFALFRLTPDKYHFNHTPVSGRVVDHYHIEETYHSCNPQAIVSEATPYSKNRRVVTIIDTDVDGGSHVGMVAMVEIVALMIGDIVQCYSPDCYDNPRPIRSGMFIEKGCPKSLYRPGSSTDVLLFEKNRIRFADDLLENQSRKDVVSRFTSGFNFPLVETDILVRSLIATALPNPSKETQS